jgi:hypothetical protein
MGDGDGRSTFGCLVERVLDDTLRLRIKSRGSFVEKQDTGIGHDSTSNGDTLLLTSREQHTALSDDRVVAIGQLADEAICIGLDTCLLDELELFRIIGVLPLGTDQTMLDITPNGSSEKGRFLRDQTDLLSKPLEVERPDIASIELDDTVDGIVESFDQSHDGRFSRTTRSDQCTSLASLERGRESLEDGYSGSRRIMELDVFECNFAHDGVWLETPLTSGINVRHTLDGGEELGGSAGTLGDGLQFGCEHGHREGTNQDGEEDIDDDACIGMTLSDEDSTVEECQTVCAIDGED